MTGGSTGSDDSTGSYGGSPAGPEPVRIAARTSPLARAQVELVGAQLTALGVPWTFVGITTVGDVDQRDLTQIGGTGVFVTGVRQALLDGRADVAVHSLKDLPTAPVPELSLVAVPERADVADVLVGRTLESLRDGDRIGTGSPRRADQLRDWAARHGRELDVRSIRGNVDGRLQQVRDGRVDAVVLAAAGLARLGHLDPATTGADGTLRVGGSSGREGGGLPGQRLGPDVVLPAPGQGALGLECRWDADSRIYAVLTRLDHGVTRAEVLAERTFLRVLEAGCTAPVGARATIVSGPSHGPDLTVTAVVGTTWTGSGPHRRPTAAPLLRLSGRGSADQPEEVGAALARTALAELS